MKGPQKKYPASLFWIGVAIDILRSFLWLVISTVLLLLGNKTPWCSIAGLALLVLVVAVAIVKQLMYRHAVLRSDSPEFADWQDAMLSPHWRENVTDRVERAMNEDIQLSNDGDDDDDGDGECEEQGED